VPVRIFFRGLVLFRFPDKGDDAGKIVAELISDPVKEPPRRDHHHDTEIQIFGRPAHAVPRNLPRGSRIDITVNQALDPERTPSFLAHVPTLSQVARAYDPALAPTLKRDENYVSSRVVINGGQIRAKSLVTWDIGSFPLDGSPPAGAAPGSPAVLKFVRCDLVAHLANEVVVEFPDGTEATISRDTASQGNLNGTYRRIGAPNGLTSSDSVEILVNNYEYQRAKPTPWGLDFQWLFRRAGYNPVELEGQEFTNLQAFGRQYGPRPNSLWDIDAGLLLEGTRGLPFPYIVPDWRPELIGLPKRVTAAEVDSRPACVPGEDDTTSGH
jgi:hypothetical protein